MASILCCPNHHVLIEMFDRKIGAHNWIISSSQMEEWPFNLLQLGIDFSLIHELLEASLVEILVDEAEHLGGEVGEALNLVENVIRDNLVRPLLQVHLVGL